MSMQLEKVSQNHSTSSNSFHWNWPSFGDFNLLNKITSFLSYESENDEIDCTIHENALKILGLSAEEAQNRSILDERYQLLCKEWNARIVKAETSEPLTKEFTKLLNRTQKAYDTLKKQAYV